MNFQDMLFPKRKRERDALLKRRQYEEQHKEYKKSPQYKIDMERADRELIAYRKEQAEEEAQRLILVAQQEAEEDLDFQEMRRQVLIERGDLVLSAEEKEEEKKRLLAKALVKEVVPPTKKENGEPLNQKIAGWLCKIFEID